jgi:hypothetical protein
MPVTEDEALDANGALKSGYHAWVSVPLMLKDTAPGGQAGSTTRMFVHDGQEKVTLTDSETAYYQMVEFDQNAWRTPSGQTATPLADSTHPAVLSDSAAAWEAMVEHDQNAWKTAHKGSRS